MKNIFIGETKNYFFFYVNVWFIKIATWRKYYSWNIDINEKNMKKKKQKKLNNLCVIIWFIKIIT